MSVAVITGAFGNDESNWECLRDSASQHSVPLHRIGQGRGYPGNDVYGRYTIPLIQSLPDEYILITDAFDVVVNRWDAGEVATAIERGNGLLVSTEPDCFPPGPWCDSYEDPGTPWRFANGGLFAGRRQQMLDLLSEFDKRRTEPTCGGFNQELFHRFRAEGFMFSLDTQCEVFQHMGHQSAPYLKIENGKMTNTLTGTVPMFLHWSGRTPGMRETWEALKR